MQSPAGPINGSCSLRGAAAATQPLTGHRQDRVPGARTLVYVRFAVVGAAGRPIERNNAAKGVRAGAEGGRRQRGAHQSYSWSPPPATAWAMVSPTTKPVKLVAALVTIGFVCSARATSRPVSGCFVYCASLTYCCFLAGRLISCISTSSLSGRRLRRSRPKQFVLFRARQEQTVRGSEQRDVTQRSESQGTGCAYSAG